MKRSALQCTVGFIGATLIVAGVVWTCRQLSSPTQLKAAQGETNPAQMRSEKATPLPGVKQNEASKVEGKISRRPVSNPIRSTSGTSQLNLTLLTDQEKGDLESDNSSLQLHQAESSQATPTYDFPDVDALDDSFSNSPVESEIPSSDASDFQSSVLLVPTQETGPAASSIKILTDEEEPAPVAQSEAPAPIENLETEGLSALQPLDDAEQPSFPQVADEPRQLDPLVETPSSDAFLNRPVERSAPSNAAPSRNVSTIPTIEAGDRTAQTIPTEANSNASLLSKYIDSVIVNQATPGTNDLNGPNTLQILVEKSAPEETLANKPATVVIKVRNQGSQTVKNILLHDSIPANTQYVSSNPEVTPNDRGDLFWTVFELEPQREKKFEYTVIPTSEGDFGSVATILAPQSASSKTVCSKPELRVEATAPEKVEVGQNVNFDIVVSNVGTGTATNVALLEKIPDGLYHPSGEALNNVLGAIKAGESKRLPLTLGAVAPGECVNRLVVTADDCEEQEVETVVNVVAPQLELSIDGSSNVYLERTSVFSLKIKNTGDAAARDVRLVAQLPTSFSFVQANNLGAYKEEEHCVYWDLAELPAQTEAVVELTLKAAQASKAEIVFGAIGPNDLSSQTSKSVVIDGLAALSFTVASNVDLLEVGKEIQYTVQIVNRGTKSSSNVVLQILAPEAIGVIATDGPTEAKNYDGVIVFDKIAEVPPSSTVTYVIKATANDAGDCRIGFQLSSNDLEPLVKEVNTRVYQ